MATRDFSRVPSAQLDKLYRMATEQPDLIPNAEERAAIIAEWEGRPAGASWGDPQPDNVESDLEASATPITPDPAVKPRAAAPRAAAAPRTAGEILIDQPPTGVQRAAEMESQRGLAAGQSLEEYGEEYGAAIRQRRKEKFADARARLDAGVQDPDQAEYNAATGVVGESSLPPMDGYNEQTKEYTTPRAPLHPMIARDRAIAAQQEEEHAQMIERKYGPEIAARWRAGDKSAIIPQHRKDDNAHWAKVEHDAYFNNDPAAKAALEARDKRQSDFYNDPRQKERRAAMKAKKDERLAHWRAMTMLAGGSNNINAGTRGMFSQLAMLPDEAPPGGGLSPRQQQLAYALPGGRERALVEAQNMQNANEVIKRFLTSGSLSGLGEGGVQREVLAGKRKAEAQAWFDNWLYQNHSTGGRGSIFVPPYNSASFERAVNYMMQVHGLSRPEAEAIAQSQGLPREAAPPPPPPDAGAMPQVSA